MQSIPQTLRAGLRRLRALSRGFDGASEPEPPASKPAPDATAFARYAAAARSTGIDKLYLFLSFDCDTDPDARAALEVHDFLEQLGINLTLAVPGAQLERNSEAYGLLAQRGVEFMNHGARPHAAWQDDRYLPTTFYNRLTADEIERDIRSGHDIVTAVTGRAPTGFRAPHFGSFQQSHQLALLYGVARDLGYQYCSTTLPQAGLDWGPSYEIDGIVELPTFGSVRAPTTVLDSWTYLVDRKDYRLSEDYADLMIETLAVLTREQIPGILSWYADPSHVLGQPPFVRAMNELSRLRVPSLTGRDCSALAPSAAHS